MIKNTFLPNILLTLPLITRIQFKHRLSDAGELGLVVGLEWDDIEPIAVNRNRPRILGGDHEPLRHLASGHVNYSDLVFRCHRDIRFLVAGQCSYREVFSASQLTIV